GILYRGKTVFVITNKYPYNSGHLMAIPYRHVSDPLELTEEEHSEMWKTIMVCKRAIEKAYHPHGYNIGMNIGRPAGAGIDAHCHLHIVPRWNGDTNFMPVIHGTKVLSEGLLQTYDKLQPFFEII
ncbi:HIT domain-containing protein, partial [bacterium]|nr:HIT domain-containing protein [bacterium]